jgi:hypothetical protein
MQNHRGNLPGKKGIYKLNILLEKDSMPSIIENKDE